MDIHEVTRTAADLLLILLIGFLALQILNGPNEISFPPPSQPHGTLSGDLAQAPPLPPPSEDLNLSAPYAAMEAGIFRLINDERRSAGLEPLEYDDELAAVAREHSSNLAKENAPLTERDLLCFYPLAHHEGFDFGLYHYDRLENRSIYHFTSSGENIFLLSSWKSRKTFDIEEADCKEDWTQPSGASEVQSELRKRLDLAETSQRVNWLFTYSTRDEMEQEVVDGWMASEGHRRNILNPSFTQSGIGISRSNDFFFVTQIFIESVDCGYLYGPCCVEEGYYPYCYAPMACSGGACAERNT